jgi:hypothetical protein
MTIFVVLPNRVVLGSENYLCGEKLARQVRAMRAKGLLFGCKQSEASNRSKNYVTIQSLDDTAYALFTMEDEVGFVGNVILILNDAFSQMAGEYGSAAIRDESGAVISSNVQKADSDALTSVLDNGWSVSLDPDTYSLYAQERSLIARRIAVPVLFAYALATLLSWYSGKKLLNRLNRLVERIKSYPTVKRDGAETALPQERRSLYARMLNYLLICTLLPVMLYMSICFFKSSQLTDRWMQRQYDIIFSRITSRMQTFFENKKECLENLLINNEMQAYLFSASASADTDGVKETLRCFQYLGFERN